MTDQAFLMPVCRGDVIDPTLSEAVRTFLDTGPRLSSGEPVRGIFLDAWLPKSDSENLVIERHLTPIAVQPDGSFQPALQRSISAESRPAYLELLFAFQLSDTLQEGLTWLTAKIAEKHEIRQASERYMRLVLGRDFCLFGTEYIPTWSHEQESDIFGPSALLGMRSLTMSLVLPECETAHARMAQMSRHDEMERFARSWWENAIDGEDYEFAGADFSNILEIE